jgi:hypothetical protein
MSEHNPDYPPPRAAGAAGGDAAARAEAGRHPAERAGPGRNEGSGLPPGDAAARNESLGGQEGPSLTERLPRPPHVIRIGGRTIVMPTSRWVRIGLGGALVLFGFFGFLPILGFWMIPLGLLILSIDLAIVRRWRRRSVVWFQRRFPGLSATLRRWTTPAPLRGGQDRR